MAKFRFTYQGVVEDGVSVSRFGTGAKPIKEATVVGVPNGAPNRIVVPASSAVLLYKWTANDAYFDAFFAHMVTVGGSALVSWMVAKPTSASDTTPLTGGANPDWRWRHMTMNDIVPFLVGGDSAHMSDNDNIGTDDAGSTSSTDLDTAAPNLPTLGAAFIVGRIYKIIIRNLGTTDITVEYGRVR